VLATDASTLAGAVSEPESLAPPAPPAPPASLRSLLCGNSRYSARGDKPAPAPARGPSTTNEGALLPASLEGGAPNVDACTALMTPLYFTPQKRVNNRTTQIKYERSTKRKKREG